MHSTYDKMGYDCMGLFHSGLAEGLQLKKKKTEKNQIPNI